MDITFDLIILFLLALLSAFFSSSELAFVYTNKIKIEIWARKDNYAAKNVNYFVNNPNNFFATILIANNVVNIAFASLATVFLMKLYAFSDISILLISSSLLLIFGELIPKYMAMEYSERLILLSILPIRVLYFIIYPLVKITGGFSSWITKSENIREDNYLSLIAKEDIHELINESSEAGTVSEDETDIINKIIDLGDQKVHEVMTPRTDIVGIEAESSIDEALHVFIESGYSKLPVYEGSSDNIKGLIFAYDMFKKPEKLNSVLRETIFVPETKKSLDMLNEFLEKRISLAIVVDEFGGTAGLVTLEDVIEEMFGEIRDEYDSEEVICRKVDEDTFVISGKYEIDRLNEEFLLNIPEGDYETIAGFITSKIGKIPKKGETIVVEKYKITIIHSDNTKINTVKLLIASE